MTESLKDLVLERVSAKRDEDAAAERRKGLDKKIAALLPKPADKSTASQKLDDLGLKLSVSYGESVTVDADKLRDAVNGLPASIVNAFSWKPAVSAAGWDALTDAERLVASQFVTRKPSAPSVKIEVV